MEMKFRIKHPEKVTAVAVTGFLQDLLENRYITDQAISYVSYGHYVPELGDEVGDSFKPKNLDEAIGLINQHGIDYLSVGIDYTNKYKLGGILDDSHDHLTRIMFHLDRAANELAEQMGHDISIDFYQTVDFQSGRFHTEWGEMPLYGLTLGSEGGYFEEDQFEEAIGILNAEMEKTCPEFVRLQEMMVARFGEIVEELDYNEI